MHLDAGAMTSRGSLLRTAAVIVTPGIELFDSSADISVRYRPAITRHVTDTATFVEQDVGPSLSLLPAPSLEVMIDGNWIQGRDLRVLLLQAAVAWRPPL